MSTRTITATLRQPVAAGTGVRKSGVQHTEHYLTGTVLRGALAARWIATHGTPVTGNPRRDEFVRLFEDAVTFGPLYPIGALPMPVSCRIHKYDAEPDCPLWFDDALRPDVDGGPCPQCGGPLRRAAGEVSTIRDRQVRSAVATREDTHVHIADNRAVTGDLFTRQRIQTGQTFTGHLHGTTADLDLITGGVRRLWLGGRRSSSGQATVTTHDHPTGATAVERLDPCRLVLRLAQPGIFVDACARPVPEPTPHELTDVLGVEAQVTRRWMRWTTVTGWHAASGFAKPAERAAERGSTYLITCTQPPAEHALAQLAARGLGLRRIEGFGALTPGPDTILRPLLTSLATAAQGATR